MAQLAAVHALSDEHKRQLDEQLIKNRFTGYRELADWLNSLGYKISKSATHNYGKKLARKVQAIEDAMLTARVINEQMGDEHDLLSEATVRFVQSEIFQCLLNMDMSPEDALPLYIKSAKAVSELSRASRDTKKYQAEVVARMQAEFDKMKDDGTNDVPTLDKALAMIKTVYGID